MAPGGGFRGAGALPRGGSRPDGPCDALAGRGCHSCNGKGGGREGRETAAFSAMVQARKLTRGASKTSPPHVALLRGVNVGGRNRLAMADLTAMFESAGAADVRTFIQSGNVVFRAPEAKLEALRKRVESALDAKFHHPIPVILRAPRALERACTDHPLRARGVDEDLLYVGFLRDVPEPRRVVALDPMRSPTDRFVVRGGEVFLFYAGGDVAKSKLTSAWFDQQLGTSITVRNLRTLTALVELAGE